MIVFMRVFTHRIGLGIDHTLLKLLLVNLFVFL